MRLSPAFQEFRKMEPAILSEDNEKSNEDNKVTDDSEQLLPIVSVSHRSQVLNILYLLLKASSNRWWSVDKFYERRSNLSLCSYDCSFDST